MDQRGVNAFANYFVSLFEQIWKDIVEWFTGVWEVMFKNVFNNIVFYFSNILMEYQKNFGFWGWLLFVLSSLFILAFLYFVAVRIVYAVARYFRFIRSEVQVDDLREEIAELNQKLIAAINEKNKILALKVSPLGIKPTADEKYDEDKIDEKEPTRFSKLRAVDIHYQNKDTNVYMTEEDRLNLMDIVDRFISYSCSRLKLYYSRQIIMLFFASMAASKVLILEGVSGTGKTSLPYAMAKFFKNNASIVSVQPSWRDRAELLGYLNEFTKKFNETDFLKALYESTYRKDISLIVLDEMNLARIEYYFAEFLSIMEMPDISEWKIDLVPDVWATDPKMLEDGKMPVPQNVWFIGTANKDDSTFTITDKVYDRAMPLAFYEKGDEFEAPDTPPLNMSYDYLNRLFDQAIKEFPVSDTLYGKLEKLDRFLISNFKLAFGNRILKQIGSFIPVYVACGGDEIEGLDYLLARKILRKFEALNITFLKNELDTLITEMNKIFGKNRLNESIQFIKELQRLA